MPCLHAGDAVAVATSTGGLANSKSSAAGNSSVVTTTLATQGGTAVADQSATEGQHSKTVVAVGDTVLTLQHDEPAEPTWDAAPVCPFSPTGVCHASCMECCKHTWVGSCMLACMHAPQMRACRYQPGPAALVLACACAAANSVKDKSDRLWGWHQGASCAFKQPVRDLWDSAPACPSNTPLSTIKVDESGREWGWSNNASCAVKTPKVCQLGYAGSNLLELEATQSRTTQHI